MPVEINGESYFTVAEVVEEIGVSRQSIWRWRREGAIPGGQRYRDRLVVFKRNELEVIRAHANRLEPIDESSPSQMKLFARRGNGGTP